MCASTAECRAGLACDMGACAPGHSLDAGKPCVISGECKDGLACIGGVCATAGSGKDGATCKSDADCASGYRCALVGLSVECVPEGKGDTGATCTTGADCFGGLACVGGMCQTPPSGSSPLGVPWKGVDCKDESGPVQAYFRVPRGMDDGDFYRLPFPNDIRLKNGKPDLTGHPTPGKDLLGYDLVDRYLRAIEKGNDGWGLHSATFFRFSGVLDYDNFKNVNAVYLVDLTTGQQMGLYYYYSIGRGSYICDNYIAVRPVPGEVYNPGDTYAVYLTNDIKAKGGAPVSRSPDLDAMLADAAPADAVLAAEWPKYAPLRAYLAGKSVDPKTLLDASVFTVGHPRQPIEKLQPLVDMAPPPAAKGWVKCDTGVASPCADATGERACGAADPDFDELHALVTLPIYQDGTAPYLTPDDGGGLKLDDTGTPGVVRTEDVCLSLTVPKGAPPAGGWPTVVFAHATGGHFRSHVVSGLAKDFAAGVDNGAGQVVKAAVLGFDQVGHGPRRGKSTASPQDLVWNFGNPAAALGNLEQGAADLMSVLRFAPSVTFDQAGSPTGAAFSLAPAVALWGHSQGAVEGAAALPYGTFAGAVLSGERGSIMDILLTTKTPRNYAAGLPIAISDAESDGTLRGDLANPVLSLLQAYLDGSDALSYARLAAKAPPSGVTAHHLFQPYGLGDTTSAPAAQKAYAIGARLGLAAHDASVKTPDDVDMLSEIPVPASGNLMSGGKPFTALLREYAADDGKDPHFVALEQASARADAERFLAGLLAGGVPVVGK
jgi:hypothetical protein